MYIGSELAEIRASWEKQIKEDAINFYNAYNTYPQLSVILLSDDEASQSYVKAKMKKLQSLNIAVDVYCLPKNCDFLYAENRIKSIVRSSMTCIIQSPTSFGKEDTQKLMNLIPVIKDADALSFEAMGRLLVNTYDVTVHPATVTGICKIISNIKPDCTGKSAVVFGRGQLVGSPVAIALRDCYNMTVTQIHSQSDVADVKEAINNADVIISASNRRLDIFDHMGVMEMNRLVENSALIIDAATIATENNDTGKVVIRGSIPEEVGNLNGIKVTPVPGGVGPFTVLGLAQNVIKLAYDQYVEI